MKKIKVVLFVCLAILYVSSVADANVTMVNDRTVFNSYGPIVYNYGFDDFTTTIQTNGYGYFAPGDPWTTHGVTYTNQNIIGWYDFNYYTNGTPMILNNSWNPVTGDIEQAGQYGLFGFDAGWGDIDDNGTTITVWTNLTSYAFNVDLSRADNTIFYGFTAGPGEYFTAFNVNTNEYYALAELDNVTLGNGNGNTVPEPTTMLLLGLGLVGLAGLRRKMQ